MIFTLQNSLFPKLLSRSIICFQDIFEPVKMNLRLKEIEDIFLTLQPGEFPTFTLLWVEGEMILA